MHDKPNPTFPTTAGCLGTAPTYDPGTVEFKVGTTTVGIGFVFCDPGTQNDPNPWHRVELLLLHPDYPKAAPRLATGGRQATRITVKQRNHYTSALHFLANAWNDLKTKRPSMTEAAYFRAGVEVFVVEDAADFKSSLPTPPNGSNNPIWTDTIAEDGGSDTAKVLIAEVTGSPARQLHQLAKLSDNTLDDDLVHDRVGEATTSLSNYFSTAACGDIYARSRIEFEMVTGGPLPARLPPAPPTFTVEGANRCDPVCTGPCDDPGCE